MTQTSSASFKPLFQRVQQTDDFNCAFACIAMLAGVSLDEVRQVAISKHGHPKHGPYWIGETLIHRLLTHFRLVGTVYRESTGIASLPDVGIGVVDYNTETEIGRHVIFHRYTPEGGGRPVEYIIDPAYWIDAAKQVRTDVKGLPIAWVIGVHPMGKQDGK